MNISLRDTLVNETHRMLLVLGGWETAFVLPRGKSCYQDPRYFLKSIKNRQSLFLIFWYNIRREVV